MATTAAAAVASAVGTEAKVMKSIRYDCFVASGRPFFSLVSYLYQISHIFFLVPFAPSPLFSVLSIVLLPTLFPSLSAATSYFAVYD